MSQQARPVLSISVLASAAIAFGQAVALTAPATPSALSGTPATAAGQKIFGVANRDAAAGATCDVTVLGTAICIAGAAIAVGARVQCDANGRVITAVPLGIAAGATAVTSAAANGTTDLVGGDPPTYVYGTALQAAVSVGDLIEVLICP
jgi:hypothetical protein